MPSSTQAIAASMNETASGVSRRVLTSLAMQRAPQEAGPNRCLVTRGEEASRIRPSLALRWGLPGTEKESAGFFPLSSGTRLDFVFSEPTWPRPAHAWRTSGHTNSFRRSAWHLSGWDPQEAEPERPWRRPSYGLGLMGDPASPSGTVWGHNGGGPGYSTSAFHAPELGRVSVCAMAGVEDFQAEQVALRRADRGPFRAPLQLRRPRRSHRAAPADFPGGGRLVVRTGPSPRPPRI